MVLVLGTLYVLLNHEKFHIDSVKRWLTYREIGLSETGESHHFPHGGGDFAAFELVGNTVVMCSTTGSRNYSLLGATFAEHVAGFTNPVLRVGTNSSVAFDAGSKVITLYKNGEAITPYETEEPILSARLNQSDWLCVVAQEKGYKGAATIFDNELNQISTIKLSSSLIVDGMVSTDNSKVALLTIGEEGGSFLTSLLLYPVGGDEAIATIPLTSSLVIDMNYQGDVVWILCEDRLILYNTSQNSTKYWSFDGEYLKNSTLTGNGFASILLGKYRAGLAHRLVTIGEDGLPIAELPISQEVLSLDSAGRYIALLNGTTLQVFTQDFEEYATLEDIDFATHIAVADDGSILLASNLEAWIYLPTG